MLGSALEVHDTAMLACLSLAASLWPYVLIYPLC